ncbi:MAG: hypothetical protein LUE87_12580 [Lachnospiraceae bacterium]|nr:hypothetical protein [Lachnospiraceae bacterium]
MLLIENLTALKALYFQDDDELLSLCREGLTVGISIIIANSQTTGIGYKYLSNISVRMALFCNDSSEYSTLFDHCRERLDNVAGRCIIDIESNHYECQSYLAFQGEKEIDRVLEIRKFISERNHEVRSSFAKKIPVIPASLTKSYVIEEFENYMDNRFSVVAGLDYATVTPYVMDFASVGLLAVTGREQAGRHNWVRYTVDMLDTMYPGQTKVYVVDGISKRMASVRTSPNVVSYSMLAEDAAVYIREMETQLKDRYDAIVAGNENALDDAGLLVLAIDNPDAIAAICAKPDALAAYKNIVGRYKNMMACIITFIENVNIPYSAPEIMKNIRDQKNILFFDDISNMKLFDVPLMTSRRFKKPIETGDGYYIRDNEYVKLKTPLSVDEQV